jgi:hypothetical protein
MARRTKAVVAGFVVAVLIAGTSSPAYAAGPQSLALSATAVNGQGTSALGTTCGDGGQGDTWSYTYSAPLGGGTFSSLPGTVTLALELHANPVALDPRSYTNGFLGPNAATTLSNTRGTLRLAMTSGSCVSPTLSFNGTTASGTGTWVPAGTGAYRQATGSGTFAIFGAGVGPGTTNPVSLNINGTITVLQPVLAITNAKAVWATPTDLINRKLTVTYTVKNNGPGDAFGVTLIGVHPTTGGVTAQFPPNTVRAVGDIAASKTRTVKVVYTLAKANPPCTAIITGCTVNAQLTLHVPDALDVPLSPDPTYNTSAQPLP